MANSPLRPPTLATFRFWGIQQELVICRHKCKGFSLLVNKQLLKIGKTFIIHSNKSEISVNLFFGKIG